MSLKVYLQHGGDADATVEDITAKTRAFKGTDGVLTAAGAYGEGTGAQGDFIVIDTDGTFEAYAHNRVTITEDASGSELWLHRGPISRSDWGRGPSAVQEAARDVHVVVNDGNSELNGLDLTAEWVRPEETGTERLLAVGAAFLNGSPRLSTDITVARKVPDGHLVVPNPDDGEATMPAFTYEVGTHVVDIIRECAETEGQNWGVTIHDVGGVSHHCLLYMEEDDFTAYPCTLSISDVLSEVNGTTVFEPWWRQGPAMEKSGGEPGAAVLSGIITEYGDQQAHIVLHDPAQVTKYDYFVEKVIDATTTSQTAATNRAPHLLNGRKREDVTHQPSLLLPAAKAHLIRPGMSISIKSAGARHEETYGTAVTRIVAQVKLTPYSPKLTGGERFYIADLNLERPKKIARQRRQPGPPKLSDPSTPGTADTVLYHVHFPGGAQESVSPIYPGLGSGLWPTSSSTVKTGSSPGSLAHDATSGYVESTIATPTGQDGPKLPAVAGVTYRCEVDTRRAGWTCSLAFYDAGDALLSPYLQFIGASSPSVWMSHSQEMAAPTGTAYMRFNSSGRIDYAHVIITALGTPGTNENNGTESCAARCDHTHPADEHEHPYSPEGHTHALSTLGDVDVDPIADGDVPIWDATTETWIAGAISSGVIDHGGLTGLADNDHPQYRRVTHGGGDTYSTVAAAGATETLDLANGNHHVVTLTEACTISVTGAAAGAKRDLTVELHGEFAVTWPATFTWLGAGAPTPESDGLAVHVIAAYTLDGTNWTALYQHSGSGVAALDDLTDVTITSVADANRLRYNGTLWVNSALHWEPMVDYDGLVMLDSAGNPSMHEVAY